MVISCATFGRNLTTDDDSSANFAQYKRCVLIKEPNITRSCASSDVASALLDRRRTPRRPMNLEHYRQRLLAVYQGTLTRLERAVAGVSEPSDGVPHDTGDESSSGELRYRQLAQVEAARTLLSEVRGALDRIENGTFGRCAEDGEPIEEARLEAVPWAAYCQKHDRRRPSTST